MFFLLNLCWAKKFCQHTKTIWVLTRSRIIDKIKVVIFSVELISIFIVA